MIAREFPGGVDDVLLDADELVRLPAWRRSALSAAGCAFAHDFLEEAYFGEKLVAEGAAHLALRVFVLGPEVIGDEVAFLRAERLNVDEGGKGVFRASGEGLVVEDDLGLFTAELVGHAGAQQRDVVPDLRLEGQFLQG